MKSETLTLVLVNLAADFKVPQYVQVQLRDGSLASIKVEIPWLPPPWVSKRVVAESVTIKGKGKIDPSDPIDVGIIASTYGGKTATEISQVEVVSNVPVVIPQQVEKLVAEESVVVKAVPTEPVNIESIENTNVGGIREDSGEVLLHVVEPKVIKESSRGVAALMKQMKQNKNSGKKGRKQCNKGGGAISFYEKLLGTRGTSVLGYYVPGPDGFTSHFFKTAWEIVGDDVVIAVSFFFDKSKLLPALNATTIVLVPNVLNPNSMKEFHHISCCNIVYKCITRITVNRIKIFLPEVISQSQSAFIPGRSIIDNTLTT
ncbi:hypothetical protein GQ457_01G026510 [Hibiscus cannabinus]